MSDDVIRRCPCCHLRAPESIDSKVEADGEHHQEPAVAGKCGIP
jgi:hypothetical protein